MTDRIKQTSPGTRVSRIRDRDGTILDPDHRGKAYGIKFIIWNIIDVRFRKERTYSLAALQWIDTNAVIYSKDLRNDTKYKLHRLEDRNDIYSLCFRKYMVRKEKERSHHLKRVQVRIRSNLEAETQRIYNERRYADYRKERRQRLQEFYGKPYSQISSKERGDFYFGNENPNSTM